MTNGCGGTLGGTDRPVQAAPTGKKFAQTRPASLPVLVSFRGDVRLQQL